MSRRFHHREDDDEPRRHDDDDDDDRRRRRDDDEEDDASSSYDDDDDALPPVPPPSFPTGGRSSSVRVPSSSPLPSRAAAPTTTTSPSAFAGSSSPGAAAAAASSTPIHTYESLARRPRSNPRVRTPMRHESPIAVPWNRDTIRRDDGDDDGGGGGAGAGTTSTRVTVRLGAGSSVGAAAATRRTATTRTSAPSAGARTTTTTPVRERSSKQGPSKRKLRRWNNDKFVGIAAEIAKEAKKKGGKSGGGPDYAEAFLMGEAESSSYLMPNHPLNYRSAFARLVDDENGDLREVKERFARGEVAAAAESRSSSAVAKRTKEKEFLDGDLMFLRIQPRLRNVVVRACFARTEEGSGSSSNASGLLDAFESYLSFHLSSRSSLEEAEEDYAFAAADAATSLLNEALLCPPDVESRYPGRRRRATAAENEEREKPGEDDDDEKGGGAPPSPAKNVARFRFDPDAPSGAFRRLLLHAVCQFHGLRAASSSTTIEEGGDDRRQRRARVLTVSGVCLGPSFRLSDFARRYGLRAEERTATADATASVVERIAAVRVA